MLELETLFNFAQMLPLLLHGTCVASTQSRFKHPMSRLVVCFLSERYRC